MEARRLAFGMLASAGVAVGHIVGYAAAHPEAAAREAALGGHTYLPATASFVIPLGVVAALVWAVRTSRELGLAHHIGARQLAAAQVALFVVQEVGERWVGGIPVADVLTERGVWLGLVAQVVIAHLSVRGLHWVRRAVRFVCRGLRNSARLPRPVPPFLSVPTLRSSAPTATLGSRAPPLVLVTP